MKNININILELHDDSRQAMLLDSLDVKLALCHKFSIVKFQCFYC